MTDPRQVMQALEGVNAVLQRLAAESNAKMREAQSVISGAHHALATCSNELDADLQRAKAEFNQCQRSGYTDSDGRYVAPDCSRERAAMDDIERKQAELARLQQMIDDYERAYRSSESRFRAVLDQNVPGATQYIHARIEALRRFESGGGFLGGGGGGGGMYSAPMMRALSSRGNHGSDYQRARQKYLRSLADDPNQPGYVRGWVKQEVNRLDQVKLARSSGGQPPGGSPRALRGIPGLDVGHRIPGVELPSNFRLEDAFLNRGRPGRARRLGVSDWIR